MKQKTSITLSRDVLTELDRRVGSKGSRSAYIERVLRRYFLRSAWEAGQARDLERINAAAEELNAEMARVLEFQPPWPEHE